MKEEESEDRGRGEDQEEVKKEESEDRGRGEDQEEAKEEGTGEQERCIAVDFLKIKMLVVIKKYWKLKIIDLM